jgi:ADP-L-glycero-D-manno-heptose 6-epimerase
MIVATGGAGFVGSNLVAGLNRRGRADVLVVDDLEDGTKFRNLADLTIADYEDKDRFLHAIESDCFDWDRIEVVFHNGACSTTTEWNGRFMMDVNYRFSRSLLQGCQAHGVPFIYASSAAVYGATRTFREEPRHEGPLNVYGWSKLAFDQHVRQGGYSKAQVVGLRYFNVYGPREQHKGSMASVAFHHHEQLRAGDTVRLFEGSGGFGPGEQRRDFVYVEDVVDTALWFWANPAVSGIFNVGTGRSQTFNDVGNAVIKGLGRGRIEYVPFPEHLRSSYQSFTEADLGNLRASGCPVHFRPVEEGVAAYVRWLGDAGVTGIA